MTIISMMLRWNKTYTFITYLLISCLVVAVLAVREYNLSGTRSFTFDVAKHGPFHSVLVPQARVDGNRILHEPVYLDVRMPTLYDTAEVQMTYTNPSAPIVRMGYVLPDGGMTLRTIEHAVLDGAQWEESPFDGYRVLRRPGAAPLNELTYAQIATYEYELPPLVPDAPLGDERTYPVTLRGTHRIQVPVSEGVLDVAVSSTEGVLLSVRHEGREIARHEGKPSRALLEALPQGMYELEVTPLEGSLVTGITTPHTKWMFVDRLQLGKLSTAQRIVVRGTTARLFAPTHEGLQELVVNGALMRIAEVLTHYDVAFAGQGSIATGKGELTIVGRGWYALDQSLAFVAQPLPLGDARALPPTIDAVYTSYTPGRAPQFTLDQQQEHRFVISVPGIAEAQPLTVHDVTIQFTQTRHHFFDYLRLWLQRIIK